MTGLRVDAAIYHNVYELADAGASLIRVVLLKTARDIGGEMY